MDSAVSSIGETWTGIIFSLYANELALENKAKRTIQIYTFPIRSASEKAALKWRGTFLDFAKGYSPPRKAGGRRPQKVKSLVWVADFLLWLREAPGGWAVLPGVALQGLCGCRVTEMLRLTWDRVDLDRGTVRVDGEIKNEHSRRLIPLPQLVVEILAEAPAKGTESFLPSRAAIPGEMRFRTGRCVKARPARWLS